MSEPASPMIDPTEPPALPNAPTNLVGKAIFAWGQAISMARHIWPLVLLTIATNLVIDEISYHVVERLAKPLMTDVASFWIVWLTIQLPIGLVLNFCLFLTVVLIWVKVFANAHQAEDPFIFSKTMIGRLMTAYVVTTIVSSSLQTAALLVPSSYSNIWYWPHFSPVGINFNWLSIMIQFFAEALLLFLIPMALDGQPGWVSKALRMGLNGLLRRLFLIVFMGLPLGLFRLLTDTTARAAAEAGHSMPIDFAAGWPGYLFSLIVFDGIWVVVLACLAKAETADLNEPASDSRR
jgi:hypothetical protein